MATDKISVIVELNIAEINKQIAQLRANLDNLLPPPKTDRLTPLQTAIKGIDDATKQLRRNLYEISKIPIKMDDIRELDRLINNIQKTPAKFGFFNTKDAEAEIARLIREIQRLKNEIGTLSMTPGGPASSAYKASFGDWQSRLQDMKDRARLNAEMRRMQAQMQSDAGYVNFGRGLQMAAGRGIIDKSILEMQKSDFFRQMSKDIADAGKSADSAGVSFKSMFGAFVLGRLAVDAFYGSLRYLKTGIVDSIKTMDEMRLSAASMAGAMQISQPMFGIERSLKNARELVQMSFAMTPGFVGTARELQILTEAAVTFGLKLDFSSQKARDQFIAFANTLKLVTQGQNFEIQAFQEIRAVMQGQNFQGAMLARRLQALGVDVQRMVPLWVQQGTVIENIVNLLGGYASASEAIRNTWEAQWRTTTSIYKLVTALGAEKAYQELLGTLTAINSKLLDKNGLTEKGKELVNDVAAAWKFAFDVIRGVYDVMKTIYTIARTIAEAVTIIVTELNPVSVAFTAVKTVLEQINELINDLTGKTSSLTEKLGLGDEGVSKAKEGIDNIFDHLRKYLTGMATGALIGASIGAVKGGIVGAGLGAVFGGAAGLATVSLSEIGEAQRESEKALALEASRKRILDSITAVYPDQAERMKELVAEIERETNATTALGRAENERLARIKAMTELQITLRREKLMPEGEGITGAIGGIRPGEGRGTIVGMPFSPSAAQTPKDKELMERLEGFEKNVARFTAKLKGDIRENLSDYAGSVDYEVEKARNSIRESLQQMLDNKTWEELYKEKPEVAKRLQEQMVSAAKLAEKTVEIKIRYKFAKEVEQQGAEIQNWLTDWHEKIAEVTGTGGDTVERAAKVASDKVNKAFRDYMNTEKFQNYLKAIGDIAAADLVEAMEKLRGDAEKVLGKDAGDKALMARQSKALSDLTRMENLRRDIKLLRMEAEIPVKMAWNADEVDYALDKLKRYAEYVKEIDRIAQAATLHKIDPTQGMNPEEVRANVEMAVETYKIGMKNLQDSTDVTNKAISNMWANMFDGIKGYMDSFWDDLLNAELKSLEDYWLAFNKMVSKMMLSMISEQFTESLKKSFGDTVTKAGESFSGLFGYKTAEKKREEGKLELPGPKIGSVDEILKQMETQTMNVIANLVNINGGGGMLPTLPAGKEYGEVFSEYGEESIPMQEFGENMAEAADTVKASGNVLSGSFMATADGVVAGGSRFINGLMGLLGGGGGEWNWWKEIGKGALQYLTGVNLGGGSSGGFTGTEAQSYIAMDAAHGGMYGLAEGGILKGGYIPIRAFAGGGVVKRPTLGLVGEGGDDEAIIPLRGGAVPVKMQGKPKESPVAIHFNIQSADVKDFDRLLYERKNMIAGIIRQELRNASGTRDEIRRYAF